MSEHGEDEVVCPNPAACARVTPAMRSLLLSHAASLSSQMLLVGVFLGLLLTLLPAEGPLLILPWALLVVLIPGFAVLKRARTRALAPLVELLLTELCAHQVARLSIKARRGALSRLSPHQTRSALAAAVLDWANPSALEPRERPRDCSGGHQPGCIHRVVQAQAFPSEWLRLLSEYASPATSGPSGSAS